MSIKVFYCYAHEDKAMRALLEKHLGNLKRQELITGWSDRDIDAGKEWKREIDSNLNTANIILLLISPDFMHSDYCYSVEMKHALERHENKTARIIPIMLRHVEHEDAPFSRLQALPTGAIPVTDRKWRTRDEAFSDIAQGIRKVVKELLSEQCLYEGNIYFYREQYNEALMAFERAFFFDPCNAHAYIGKGQTLNQLASHQHNEFDGFDYHTQALAAFEQAISLDPTNSLAYEGEGKALFELSSWRNQDKVLSAYEQAIRFDPKNETAYIGQGEALMSYFRHNEAIAAFEKAIEVALFPSQNAFKGKADALCDLKCYEEALKVYEQIIQDYPANRGYAYNGKGNALYHLERREEAITAYNKAISLGFISASLYTSLGDLLCQLGDYQRALDAYEQAIQLDSYRGEAYRGKGEVLKLLAEIAFKEADEKDDIP